MEKAQATERSYPDITPYGPNIAVIKATEVVSDVIAVPDAAIDDTRGTVVAISDYVKEHYPEVSLGSTVIFGEYTGSTVKHEGVDYTFMDIDSILAVQG